MTRLRLEVVAQTQQREEQGRQLAAARAALEEERRGRQHWQWRAEDSAGRVLAEEARAAALLQELEGLQREGAELRLQRVADAKQREDLAAQ